MSFLAAAVQLSCTSDEEANLEMACELVGRAAGYGARLAVTPENTNYLGPHEEKVRRAQSLEGPVCGLFSDLARRHSIYLILGSFNERCENETGSGAGERCYNTSVLFAPDGVILAVYRKMHLFDVDVSPEVSFTESATVKPGRDLVVAETELGRVGFSICYDLRFPELYSALVRRGAQLLTVPSAFTLMTGKDHWYALLRARAIETQTYLLAPAQSGRHDDEGLRHSYGHSLIIDPWGQVVATASEGPGLALAEIELERVVRVRASMPVAKHRRLR